ncbi:hypothetical protein KAT95_01530 [Candidatus Parcubacteria bacterium]|nr:hypothetical protein [Candidatus Parcubacteria bacterium]
MFSQETEKLIQKYQEWHQSLQPKKGVSTIHVDEVAARVAAFYEKIKGVIDWKEEHLLRKRAIERSLKRRIIFGQEKREGMAESLIYELIRGGHFLNDTIPESKITVVDKLIDKYFYILENRPNRPEKEKKELQDWLIEIASYELEKTLSPPVKEEVLIEYMFGLIKEQIKIREGTISMAGITIEKMTENEKNIQIYIAVQKALFKVDDSIIGYNLLEKQYIGWDDLSPSSSLLLEIAQNIYSTKRKVEKALYHPLAQKFYHLCEKYDTPYLILGDVIEENPMKVKENFEKPEILEELIKKSYNKRVIKLKGVMRRAAIYSTLSIFITKMVLALSIEIPFDKFITSDFNYLSLGVNILFPPFLMFLLVASVRAPKKENLQRVIIEVMKLVFVREKKDIYEIKIPKKRGKILNSIILGIYFLAFVLSFGIIILILQRLDFGTVSMIIFLLFLSMISFFGVKIRERGKELTIEKEKETFLGTLFDFFTLPVVSTGRWFSKKWAKLNIALIIAALIDMPFLSFVKFLEQWRYFLKEKKEEIH